MRVPRINRRIAVRDRRPIELHEARPGFDQSAGQQRPLAEGRPAVLFPDLRLFLLEVEGIARLAGQKQVIGSLVILVQRK